MAQGVGSILGGPAAAWLHDATGSWLPVFGLVIAMDIITALLALFLLKPIRHGYIGGVAATAPKLRAAE
jgi:cyanate permease